MGYSAFISEIDALVMGRVTFETVCNFGIDWPYTKPVFVLSNSLKSVDEKFKNKIEIVNGTLSTVLENINSKAHYKLYIDGGQVIQSFLIEDLIDELTVTTMPILLGGGYSLFGDLDQKISLNLIRSEIFLDAVVQTKYARSK